MIHCTFREPNFQCRVHDEDGNRYEWLTYANSEATLRQRLENRGFEVDAIEPYDFSQWKTRAADETQRIVDAYRRGEPIVFNSHIWSQLKFHIFEIFHDKCAYCESKVLHVASGDVEHYRPKKKVDGVPHPGYYWLAYNEDNLLPCCEKCNRVRGKRNHFPINGQRAHSPADALDAENPLMLNPYKDHPEEHLSFPPGIISPERELVCIGTVEGTSPVGAQTIVICNLRRPQLCEERKKEQERFVNDLLLAMNRLDTAKIVSIWYDVLRGIRPYSAAVLAQSEVLGQMGIVCPQEARELAAATLACSDS